jgi:peptidoglycan glycosyltransferase
MTESTLNIPVELLIRILQAAFILLQAILLLQVIRSMPKVSGKIMPQAGRMRSILYRGIIPIFLLIFLYQGYWQLTGFLKPQFISFMRRYDHRPDNPAHKYLRGSILDRNQTPLAFTIHTNNTDIRQYPFGNSICHVVGYYSRKFGLTGVEKYENSLLSGCSLDSTESLKRFGRNITTRKQIEGGNVQLTIDARLQQHATRLLANRCGAIVAIQPATGEIIALASSPAFNPANPTPAISDTTGRAPLLNRAIHGLYPPGSTFKLVVAAAALERGSAPNFNCPVNGIAATPGSAPIRDHEYYACQRRGKKWRGRGNISMKDALTHSSNVYFAQLGLHLGWTALRNTSATFGIGKRFRILAGDSGKLTSSASKLPKKRDRCSLAQTSIGQGGLLVTPLQMAFIVAVIGNNGSAYQPHLKNIAQNANPPPPPRILSPKTAQALQWMMRSVVEHGTARAVQIDGLAIAGKTGTAQAPHGKDHSWFVCLAPSPHPELAIAVIIEHGGYGSAAAIPAARELLLKALELGIIHKQKEPAK